MHELSLIRLILHVAGARIAEVRARAREDVGASPLEWAVTAGIGLTAALGVGAVVVIAVNKYKGRIQ